VVELDGQQRELRGCSWAHPGVSVGRNELELGSLDTADEHVKKKPGET